MLDVGKTVYFTGWEYNTDGIPGVPDSKWVQNKAVTIISIEAGTPYRYTVETKNGEAWDCTNDCLSSFPLIYDTVNVICPNCQKVFDCGEGTANFWWGGIYYDEENIRCPHCQASTEIEHDDIGRIWEFEQFKSAD